METFVWILIVQLWSEPPLPPAIKIIHSKEYPTYAECMQARLEHIPKYVAICGMKRK